MINGIVQLGILLLLVFIVSIIIKSLKQPLIIGYIISGILAGPYFLNLLSNADYLHSFSEIGIVILLFIVGLNLNTKIIKEVGKIAILLGFSQIIITSSLGFLISYFLLSFSKLTSLYIGIALTFSSTIIITKVLSDKGEIDTLHGKLAIGLLIVQDIFAILILMLISSLSSTLSLKLIIATTLIKWVFLISSIGFIGYYIFPKITKNIARSQELLLLFSITWCFIVSSIFYLLGFSVEIGALLAGSTLAMSNYKFEIESKLKPLRDFFIIMFFIFIGNQIVFSSLKIYIKQLIVLSLFVIILNPIIIMSILGFLKFKKKTIFNTSMIAGQISEFSLIIIALGIKLGHLNPDILSLITVVGVITYITSSYTIINVNSLYKFFSPFMNFFERKNKKNNYFEQKTNKKYETILLGYNRIGYSILKSLNNLKNKYLIVDYNPEAIKSLKKQNIDSIYGDAGDIEFLEEIKITKAKLIISTVPDFDSNMLLLEHVREENKNSVIIVTSSNLYDGLELYEQGADYVILPHFIGGKYVSSLIKKFKSNKKKYAKERSEEIKYITKKIAGELYHN